MCLGGSSSELAIATNTAIGLMLSCLVLVLGSFLAFIIYLARKAKAVEEEAAVPVKVKSNDNAR